MTNDHQDTLPPTTTTIDHHHHHHQPSSSTANFTKPLPQTPSPMSPTNTNTTQTNSNSNSTPESRIAAALGRAFLNIPPSSFQDAATTTTTTNPLLRTLSDADSSANQTTTTTPPKVPRNNNNPRRTLSDSITPDYQQTKKTGLRRTLSDTSEYQLPQKTPRVSSSPQSSSGRQSPQSEVIMRKVEDMVRDIEQRCWEIMREEEEHVEEEIPKPHEQEECVGVERMKNGDLRFELSCSCGKRFEMLIKHNGYCFYRLT